MMEFPASWPLWAALPVTAGAALICALLIRLLHPLLVRYALARPNARSAHREPTPQGGGIAVIAATFVVSTAALAAAPLPIPGYDLFVVSASVILISLVGAADDIRAVAVMPRLLAQTLAVAAIIAILPPDVTFVSALPWWIERVLLVIGGVWFVNLVNFMDGLDWMTVAETVPLAAALALLGALGTLPPYATIVALALLGAMLGFAPSNRPLARLFLGDVGSLPIGIILGWLLLLLAAGGHLAAALLLPLYYLADATITLLRRLLRREAVWQAHRSHFYQRAMDRGMPVLRIVTGVFLLNIVLAALATATALAEAPALKAIAAGAGALAVAGFLVYLEKAKP